MRVKFKIWKYLYNIIIYPKYIIIFFEYNFLTRNEIGNFKYIQILVLYPQNYI